MTPTPSVPREIAPGVFCLRIPGRTQTNVYFVHSGSRWVLIDAGWAGDGARIAAAAAALGGPDGPPGAILLTHAHPDHAGSARELARAWAAPVYVHPAELAIARGDFEAMTAYAGPLDAWLILPLMRAAGRGRREALLARSSLGDVVRSVDPEGTIAALPDWLWVHSPGHTPGHLSFFRPADRVLLSGDALLTLRVNSASGMLLGSPGMSGPPRYTTWSWPRAVDSIVRLADLEPSVLGPGHGTPALAPDTPTLVAAFARRLTPAASHVGPEVTPPRRAATSRGQPRLSSRERVGLLLHRQLDRRLSRFGVWLMRRTHGSLADRYRVHALVLSTVGRRTGRARAVVLQYFPDGDAFVVVATNDGSASDPAWYLNLMASGRGEVEVRGRRVAVTPERLGQADASTWWARILELSPDYERYARATDRAFPVVRLVPTDRGGPAADRGR